MMDTGYWRMATDLNTVLDRIKTWKSEFPITNIELSEEILAKIIETLKTFGSSVDSLESQISTLKMDLETEVQMRKKLELQVEVLNSKLTARDTDLKTLNYLMDVFGLLKNFIMRVEISQGNYSSAFRKLSEKDVIDSLKVEPIDDILDSYDQKERKTFLLNHTCEANLLFQNLALDSQLVFDLNQRIHLRNFSTHNLDNKKYKNATYVQEKLAEFLTVMGGLTTENELAPVKESITGLVNKMISLHVEMLNKIQV